MVDLFCDPHDGGLALFQCLCGHGCRGSLSSLNTKAGRAWWLGWAPKNSNLVQYPGFNCSMCGVLAVVVFGSL